MPPKTVLVTGANGYIGNAVARAFVRAGWITYGLVRSAASTPSLAQDEIIPIIGCIDDVPSHQNIREALPSTLNAIISTTENIADYIPHYTNTIHLLRTLSTASLANGVRPLVVFTSGCKDYGVGPHYDGQPGLAPHTEESPINPPPFAIHRAEYSKKIFDHTDVLGPVLVRPTNVFGRSASYYRSFFEIPYKCGQTGTQLVMAAPKNAVCHALHVDDCGDAYVAIAEHPRREEVDGEVFNISAYRYETVGEIANALVAEYGLTVGARFVDDPTELKAGENPWPPLLIDFPQWTGSEKLRRVTGWKDVRPLFSEAVRVYRVAYEAARESQHGGIEKIKRLERLLGLTPE